MGKRFWLVFVAVLLLFSVSSSVSPVAAASCTQDCGAYVCSSIGTCYTSCYGSYSSSSQCSAGYSCVSAKCTPDPGTPVCDEANCGGYACYTNANICYSTSCQNNFECAESDGYKCVSGTCQLSVSSDACASDSDCSTGYACDTSNGICHTSCASSTDCSSGYTCDENSACVAETAGTSSCAEDCGAYTCSSLGPCYTDCGLGGEAVCSAGYSCVSAKCTPDPGTPVCDEANCGGYACDTNKNICYSTSCQNNFECAEDNGYKCDSVTGTCQYVSSTSTGCGADSDCLTGYDCNEGNGFCYTSCISSSGSAIGCTSGYACASDSTCSLDADNNGVADVDEAGTTTVSCATIDDCSAGNSCVNGVCVPADPDCESSSDTSESAVSYAAPEVAQGFWSRFFDWLTFWN